VAAAGRGQIVESWQVWDTLAMLQQLGAIPAPASVTGEP